MTERYIKPERVTNTHILVENFDYFQPTTIKEAVTLLKDKKGARIIAGGTHLLTVLKMERDQAECLISLQKIPGLSRIELTDSGEIVIGACTTIRDIRNHPIIQEKYPALAEACASFGSTQIQMMGTVGGNICNGSPAADTVPALHIYDARLIIQGTEGRRETTLKAFLLGPGKVNLKDGEILESVVLPAIPSGCCSGFLKITRVAADLSKASLALLVKRTGDRLDEVRIAFGSVAPTVVRAEKLEAHLRGKVYTDSLLVQAAGLLADAISPIDDVRSSAQYRQRIVEVMFRDLFTALWDAKYDHQKMLGQFKFHPYEKDTTPAVNVKRGDQTRITFWVNGVEQKLWVAPNELLLNVLRERLELTGAKYGCGLGECSACTVEIDGQPMLSCLTLAASVDGKHVVTVEGMQKPDGELHPLQQSFIDYSAYQCGYCTPGFLVTLKCLLEELPKPTEMEIRDYLKGNRCRCTGYVSIVKAVNAVVEAKN